MTNLLVSEVFGPTVQGEGPDLGKPCVFLRLAGCSVQCEWCDTKYTWEQGFKFETLDTLEVAGRLMKQVGDSGIDRLVISGGEPLQQSEGIYQLLRDQTYFSAIEIETSGVCPPILDLPDLVYNVSPKLSHAHTKRPYIVENLAQFLHHRSRWKFVVQSLSDFDEIDDIVSFCQIDPRSVWIMPLGVERHELMERTQKVVDETIKRRFNLTTRLHILIWGNKRGV